MLLIALTTETVQLEFQHAESYFLKQLPSCLSGLVWWLQFFKISLKNSFPFQLFRAMQTQNDTPLDLGPEKKWGRNGGGDYEKSPLSHQIRLWRRELPLKSHTNRLKYVSSRRRRIGFLVLLNRTGKWTGGALGQGVARTGGVTSLFCQ